jgi:hypothetical protein
VQLRAEVDAAIERAETTEKKNKDLEQTVLERDHEVKSLGVRAEDALEKSEAASKETTAKCVMFFFLLSSVFHPSLPCPYLGFVVLLGASMCIVHEISAERLKGHIDGEQKKVALLHTARTRVEQVTSPNIRDSCDRLWVRPPPTSQYELSLVPV